MSTELVTRRHEHALVLTLQGPASRNCLGAETLDAALEALEAAEADAQIRCIVLTGAGGHFSAGGDLRTLKSSADSSAAQDQAAQLLERFHLLIQSLRTLPKPVIAAVEGHAAGGGFSLALACDLLLASEDAQFHMSYARIGLSPDGAATWHLMQMLPRALAAQWLWLGEAISVTELARWGLVNEVCPAGTSLARALAWSERLSVHASAALASIKEQLNAWPLQSMNEQLTLERQHFLNNLSSDACLQSLRGFFNTRQA